MTGRSASVFGLDGRGVIETGAYADLVIFIPDTVNDRATYESPKLHSDGIDYVFVNGKLVWGNNEPTCIYSGMFLSGKKFNKNY